MTHPPVSPPLAELVDAHLDRARTDLAESVAFASVHDDPDRAEENLAGAQWVADRFTELGFACEVIETSDGSRAIVGHRPGPDGARTVALYSHHDVQPAGDEALWDTPPFALTERDGRWYGRGAADCKGNLVAHLTALRAVGDAASCHVRIIVEGSEEAGGEGLDHLVRERPELFDADLILIGDTGNVAVGVPTLTTGLRGVVNVRVRIRTLETAVHSGQFGGAAPDAMAALIALLATLRDEAGDTTIDGLDGDARWAGADYPAERFRTDAGVLPGVGLLGSGTPADMVWARPAVTVIGIDAPSVDACAAAIIPEATALLNLRIPPGVRPQEAYDALETHLRNRIGGRGELEVTPDAMGAPFAAKTDGPGYAALTAAMREAYDDAEVVHSGQGGSIPLCTVLAETVPHAEIALLGVEEPQCRIHAPNESVDPGEIRRTALAEAILLTSF
ncbi:MAG: dipeptidase [Gordonia sp. (in: high G+C Gram-positive bacteria)]|uniref:dipeptidase n=1 Tax=Gordonia sp. (in: high G+C Gram-positive bacteria) TaxID=84139 RepID=UPI0039E2A48F